MVRWDSWTDGNSLGFTFCECPTASTGTPSDSYVGCTEIEIVREHVWFSWSIVDKAK